MHLKSLHLIGFKTFADETDVSFDPGFTAVVGPNGSGKSNIVDGVKWVFGEKSAKGLRGEKMDDVIFHGTESRSSSGFAEVTIVFSNEDNTFALATPEVRITRRLYPDGNNEYYINDSKSIRKDIERLFLDTGMGKSSYSIMEQGKVDQLLYSKPEERRNIFEEAAGISRFKTERKVAEKKLQDTQANLLRISDILRTMERELDTKDKQRARTEEFLKLNADLKETDKNIRFLKFHSLNEKKKNADFELEEVKQKNQNLLNSIQAETEAISKLEQEKSLKEEGILEIDKKLLEHLNYTKLQKEKIEKNKVLLFDYSERLSQEKRTYQEQCESLDAVRLEIQNLKETKKHVLSEIISHESLLQTSLELKQQKDFEREQSKEAIQKIDANLKEKELEYNALREDLKLVTSELILEIEKRKKEAIENEKERERLKETILESIKNSVVSVESGSDQQTTKEFLNKIESSFNEYLSIDDVFRSLFLDENGVFSRKESIDQTIEDILLSNEIQYRSKKEKQDQLEKCVLQAEEIKERISTIEKNIIETNSKKMILVESIVAKEQREEEIRVRSEKTLENIQSLTEKTTEFELEITNIEKEIEQSYQEFLDISKVLEKQKQDLLGIQESISNIKKNVVHTQEEFKNLFPILSEKERNSNTLKVQIDTLQEELYNDYSITVEDLEKEKDRSGIKLTPEETKFRKLKLEIQTLGSINLLAIEEYNSIKQVYDHNTSQKEDIESSKRDIEKVLHTINLESEKLFLETFEKIRTNFQYTFSTLFNGGRAELELSEREDSLNSGIEILAEPPGKHVQNLRLLSGGEKSLTAIALMFAIYMVKPSPFCFLDEIDAALDEANKLRFCNLLDQFKNSTQFIVVSHAQITIARANAIFGVTNEEAGVSKLVSLRLEEAKEYQKNIPLAAANG